MKICLFFMTYLNTQRIILPVWIEATTGFINVSKSVSNHCVSSILVNFVWACLKNGGLHKNYDKSNNYTITSKWHYKYLLSEYSTILLNESIYPYILNETFRKRREPRELRHLIIQHTIKHHLAYTTLKQTLTDIELQSKFQLTASINMPAT